MPGVFAVYTARDLLGLVEPVRALSRLRDYRTTALQPLAHEKARYVGEPVVAVLGETRSLGEDALDQIEIAYEPLEVVIDPEEAAKEDGPLLHEEAGIRGCSWRDMPNTSTLARASRPGARAPHGRRCRGVKGSMTSLVQVELCPAHRRTRLAAITTGSTSALLSVPPVARRPHRAQCAPPRRERFLTSSKSEGERDRKFADSLPSLEGKCGVWLAP